MAQNFSPNNFSPIPSNLAPGEFAKPVTEKPQQVVEKVAPYTPPKERVLSPEDIGTPALTLPTPVQKTEAMNNLSMMTQMPDVVEEGRPMDDQISQLQALLGEQEGLGQRQLDIQNEMQVFERKQASTMAQRRLEKAQIEQQRRIEEIQKNAEGKFGGAVQQDITEYRRQSDRNIADLAITANYALEDYQMVTEIAQAKFDAIQEPLKAKIDTVKTMIDVLQNDLTESEKMEMQTALRMKEAEMEQNRELVNNALISGATQDEVKRISNGDMDLARAVIARNASQQISLEQQLLNAQIAEKQADLIGNSTTNIGFVDGERVITTSSGEQIPVSQIDFEDPQQLDALPVSDETKAVLAGVMDYKKLTPTQTAKIGTELYKIGFNPKEYVMPKLQSLVEAWANIPETSRGVVEGMKFWEHWTNPQVAQFESAKTLLTREIARLFDVGVLSDQDVKSYKDAMPSRQDTSLEVVLNKAAGIGASATGRKQSAKVGTTVQLANGQTAIVGADGDTLLDPVTGKPLEI